MSIDTRLLSGLIALDRQYIKPDDLVAAFRLWRVEPRVSLHAILVSQGRLTPEGSREVSRLEEDLARSGHGEPDGAGDPDGGGDAEVPNESQFVARFQQEPTSDKARREPEPSRYRPVSLYRAGGLGEVYLADDLEVERQVALKQIKPAKADNAHSRLRFLAEARITGGLEHPGIVPVYGIGQDRDGRPFYAMRFIKGQTLRDAVNLWHKGSNRDFQTVEFRNLLQRFIVVCHAIGYAHSRRVLHRDIKPSNIMLGEFGETLVVDWGLAKVLGDAEDDTATYGQDVASSPDAWRDSRSGTASDTKTGDQLGTPYFMSPEQSGGRPQELTPASDVYSLGATLHVLVTGRTPEKQAETSDEAVSPHGGDMADAGAVRAAPKALLAICRKAMASSPAKRYSTALELAADIERWLADEPVSALPERWMDKRRRWFRRHQKLVYAAIGFLTLTSVIFAAATFVVNGERNRADQARQLAQSNAELTRDVLDQLFLKIGDDRWSRIPGFASARIEMVNLAIERYRDLARRQPDDYHLRSDLALALRRAANLHRMVNRFDRAEPLIEEAVKMMTTLLDEHPDEPELYTRLIDCLIDQADLTNRVRGPAAAEAALKAALDKCRVARTEFRTSVGVNRAFARTSMELAALQADLGRDRAAFELSSAGTDVYRVLLATPQDRTTMLLAALAWNKHAQIASSLTPVDANLVDTAFTQAIDLARELERDDHADPNARFVLAVVLLEQSRWQVRHTGAESADDKNLEESIRLLDDICEEHQSVGSFRRQQSEAWLEHGARLLAVGDITRARMKMQGAFETLQTLVIESFGADTYRLPMADALILKGRIEQKAGEHDAAVQAWRAAREQLTIPSAQPSRAVNDRLEIIDQLLTPAPKQPADATRPANDRPNAK